MSIIFISLVITFFVFPLLIYMNGKIPLATPINNIIATLFWGFIFIPFSIFIVILSFLNENIAIKLANILGDIFELYIKIPFFEIVYQFPIPVNLVLISIFIVLSLFLFFKYLNKSYKKYILWFLISIVICLFINYLYSNVFYITVFDVGRGNAIWIKNKEKNILIDTGPNYFYKDFDWTKIYLVPVLTKLGIDTIDLIIISHPDLDHSGGLKTLENYFYIRKVISGNFEKEDWEKVNILILPEVVAKNLAFKIKEAEFFLFPGKRPYKNLNRESLVTYLEYKGLTVLFPGDIDKKRFYRMKNLREIISSEVLISPHHGSRYGLNKEILKLIDPKVVITSGRGKYFPHPQYSSLIQLFNIPHFVTSEKGAIYIFPKSDYFLICSEKEKRAKFLSRILFPLVPGYFGENFCKRFNYHQI